MENGSPSRTADHPLKGRHHVAVMLLAMTSGALDAIGFLGLGGVFASVMTGNVVLLGLSAGSRNASLAAHAVVAIFGYVIGVTVGVRVAGDRAPTRTTGWSKRVSAVLDFELGLVLAFAIGWEFARGKPSTPSQLALIGIAATAMGLQSAVVRVATGVGTSTTYLTGTLTDVVATLASGRALRLEWTGVTVLAAALVGAVLAGTAVVERSTLAPIVPLLALVGGLVLGRTLITGERGGTPPSGATRTGAD
jgi:uncharacterized membrane protein YoaK (UPF0700 family)